VGTVTSLRKVILVSYFQHGSQNTPVRDLSVFPCEHVDKICTLSSLPALHFMSVQASAISIDRGAHSYFALLHLPALLFYSFHFLLLSFSLFLSFSFIRPFCHRCGFNLTFLLFQSFSLNLSFFVVISIIPWHSAMLLLCFHFGGFFTRFGFQLSIFLHLIVFSKRVSFHSVFLSTSTSVTVSHSVFVYLFICLFFCHSVIQVGCVSFSYVPSPFLFVHCVMNFSR